MDIRHAKDSVQSPLLLIGLMLWLTLVTTPHVFADQSFRLRAHTSLQNLPTTDDIKAEINFGRSVAARILGKFQLYSDDELTRYVNLVGKAVALHSERTEINYYFGIIQDEHANAYSAPGGYIFITTGALQQMEDEAELAAVLAHEIAHVTEKHIVKELNIKGIDSSATSSLGQILSGTTNTTKAIFNQIVDKAVNILLEKGYKQQDELDADRIAIQLMALTGYDPTALSRYLSRLQSLAESNKEETANHTHPPSEKRFNNIASLMQEEQLDASHFTKTSSRFKQYVTF